MKYLYTLFALFLIIGMNAQTTTITFSEAGLTASACDGNIKGDSGVTATIADDGAGNKYLSASSGAVGSGNDWKNTQIRLTNELGDGYTFSNHLVAGAGSSISFKIWTEDLSAIAKNANGDPFTGMIKFEKGLNGAGNIEFSFNISDTGGWQDITVDLGTDKGGNAVAAGSEYGLIVFFNNYGTGSIHNAGLRYYDDITYENGSAIVAADASLVPPTAAPTPTHGSLNTDPNADAADVFNIFSDHYPNSILWCPDNEARAGWSAGGATKPYSVNGEGTDAIVMQENLEYIGSYWNGGGTNKLGPIDLSNFANVNIDIYFQELTGTDHKLGIALLTPDEKLVSYDIPAGAAGWRTITLDLSEYGTRLDEVNGIKIEGMIPAGGTRWTPDISWDNLFAWNAPSANTVATFSVNANNAGALFDSAGGEVFAISYSTDGGNTYTISNPLADADSDGIWTGSLTIAKDGSTVQYKVVTTDATSGYTTANDSSGDALANDADFSFTAATNTVTQDLFILDRDTGAFATTAASAKVDVTIQVDGFYPGQTYGQYGIIPPDGTAVYALGAITDGGNGTNGDGILQGVVAVPFYSTFSYDLHFNNDALAGASWDNLAHPTKDATTNASFSVAVVEDDVIEYLSPITAEDANGNFITYSASLSINDINVELTIYPNPADQFISVKSSEVLSGIRVIDMTGKEVIRKSIKSNDYSLDIGNLNTGIYFLEATSNGASKTMRFIKK